MRRLLLLLPLVLVACGDSASGESSRGPAGNPNAAVLVTEFADLQCPACRAAHESIEKPILEKYGNQIRYEFMHFPLRQIHRFAMDLAEMSECAADQGKFWEFADIAYTKQPEVSLDAILEWAEEIGLDTDIAEKCWKSHAKRKTVLADYKLGRERGVQGTPTFFVNGEKVQTGFDMLSEAIEAALEGAMMKL